MKTKKHRYNGRMMTVRELSELPECTTHLRNLRHRIKIGWTIKEAVLGRPKKTIKFKNRAKPTKPKPKKVIPKEEIDRIKKIMSVPIKDTSTQYYYLSNDRKKKLAQALKGL